MSFAENLKALRRARGIDQITLAKILNVSPKTVSHWETGYTEPAINQLITLSKYFGVSLDSLVENNK